METAAYTVGATAIVVIGVFGVLMVAWKRGMKSKHERTVKRHIARDLRHMPKATEEEIKEYMGER